VRKIYKKRSKPSASVGAAGGPRNIVSGGGGGGGNVETDANNNAETNAYEQ
jgi:hypothetical protein